MKIYFFKIDKDTGIHEAGFTVNGKRYIKAVWSQAGKNFVTTGMKVTHDFERHDFTDAQEKAYAAFVESGAYTVDIVGGC